MRNGGRCSNKKSTKILFYASLTSKRDTHKLILRDGVWFQNDKVFLSPNSTIIPLILIDSHSSPIGGHFGFHKTLHRISQSFFWPKMQQTVKDFLKTYEVCQQYKPQCMKPVGLLQPLPIPTQSWINVSMDFIEGLHMADGYSVIMVVVDRLTIMDRCVHGFHRRSSHAQWAHHHHGGS